MSRIILQPTGGDTQDDFLENNYTSWAESEKYRDIWEDSVGDIVLFIKDREIFALAIVENIEEDFDTNSEYPLRYYWNNNIKYVSILLSDFNDVVGFKNNYFPQNYRLIKDENVDDALNYINSFLSFIYDEDDDELYQADIQDAISTSSSNDKVELKKDIVKQDGCEYYPRNPSIAKFALQHANYNCELNNEHKTFISNNSSNNYVEAHHLIPLALHSEFNYCLDVPANIIALCPNCHRMLHSGIKENINEALKLLHEGRKRRLESVGINATLDELQYIYGENK